MPRGGRSNFSGAAVERASELRWRTDFISLFSLLPRISIYATDGRCHSGHSPISSRSSRFVPLSRYSALLFLKSWAGSSLPFSFARPRSGVNDLWRRCFLYSRTSAATATGGGRTSEASVSDKSEMNSDVSLSLLPFPFTSADRHRQIIQFPTHRHADMSFIT